MINIFAAKYLTPRYESLEDVQHKEPAYSGCFFYSPIEVWFGYTSVAGHSDLHLPRG
jgi:hypothetical protein